MDVTSLIGDAEGRTESKTAVEYRAEVVSVAVSGDATLKFSKEGVIITTLFDAVEIPFADMNELSFQDYVVCIITDSDTYAISKLGNWGQPFFGTLCDTYNEAVRKALFTTGDVLLKGTGGYSYAEGDVTVFGQAPVEVFEDCVIVLPTNLEARRVPLHFLTGLDKDASAFALTLRVDDDTYTFSKLGHETDLFERAVIKQAKALREKTLEMVQSIDPTLSSTQAAQVAKLMPGGATASLEVLAQTAPSFVAVAEEMLAKSRAGEYYPLLKEIGTTDQLRLGFLAYESSADSSSSQAGAPDIGEVIASGGFGAGEQTGEGDATKAPSFIFYAVVPCADKTKCAVEFGVPEGESAATFIYRCDEGFDQFVNKLNRGMEAVDYKRDVISMDDEKLKLPENRRYAMAVKRSPALCAVRAGFLGRAIHSSVEAWRKTVEGHFA